MGNVVFLPSRQRHEAARRVEPSAAAPHLEVDDVLTCVADAVEDIRRDVALHRLDGLDDVGMVDGCSDVRL